MPIRIVLLEEGFTPKIISIAALAYNTRAGSKKGSDVRRTPLYSIKNSLEVIVRGNRHDCLPQSHGEGHDLVRDYHRGIHHLVVDHRDHRLLDHHVALAT